MDLTIPSEVGIKFITDYGKPEFMDPLEDWNGRWNKFKTIDVRLFERAQLTTLRASAMEVHEESPKSRFGKMARALAQDIAAYISAEDDTDSSKPVRNLRAAPLAIVKFFDQIPKRWMMHQRGKGFNPRHMVAGISATYHEEVKRKDDYQPPYVTVAFRYWVRGKVEQVDISFRTSACNQTVKQILQDCGMTVPTPEDFTEYDEQLKNFDEWRVQLGEQFTTTGYGKVDGGSYWNKSMIKMSVEGNPARMVCDDVEIDEDEDEDEREANKSAQRTVMVRIGQVDDSTDDGSEGEVSIHLPVNALIRFFDLSRHAFYIVHVADVEPYVYDESLVSKLVMAKQHKNLVNTLLKAAISTEGALGDIVRGKSGGTSILCHGRAGTGKSLTAECFSECAKRPLYLVQCAQLGLDVGEVEKSLKLVLNRASRWRAVLLIDEADVYVMKRGNDMHQNAVIGTFLRLLEYFDGILFMTTNRGGDVDDAIRSRCIAEIEYGAPDTKEDKVALWTILGTHYGISMKKLIDRLVKEFPDATGRDIKQLCRLVRINFGQAPTIQHFKDLSVYKPGGFGKDS